MVEENACNSFRLQNDVLETIEGDSVEKNKCHSTCSSDVPSPAIFKLNIDCFHEVFDWLSHSDLIAVGQTCKRLRRIVGMFVHFNYGAKTTRGENNGIYISSLLSNTFSQYIQKLSISGDRLGAYRFVGENCTNSINNLRVYGTLPENGFEHIKDILNGIEILDMNECVIKGDFYEDYLKYCPNVKSLSVSRSGRISDKSIIIGSRNSWLLRNYPNLENFELLEAYELKMNELNTFFQQNPNIRTFSTDSKSLWENRNSIMNVDLKFEKFAIDIYQSRIFDSNNQPISMLEAAHNLLVQLYEKGFYKWLHLCLFFIGQQCIDKLFSLRGLEMLIGDIVRIDRLLPEVRAFAVWCGDEIVDIESVPRKLPNVERIYFSKITFDRILPFIRHTTRLKQIRIRQLKDECKILDLLTMNKERKKLSGACKVHIYVKEDVYLATKWASNTIDLSLIELKRYDSMEWEELSARGKYLKSF